MEIDLKPGRYVVAVSGGVDSAVLLDMLSKIPGLQLTVAHFDHGIREDSAEDVRHVRGLAGKYGYPFVYARGNLGPSASEAAAREARYRFLHAVREAAKADALITAHHQDDALETALINIVRGTGRRGLTSLKSMDIVKRPLLHVPKEHIHRYARDNQILRREDSTNQNTDFLRNRLRHQVIPKFSAEDKIHLHDLIAQLHSINEELDRELQEALRLLMQNKKLDRSAFIRLPHAVSREIMATWLRESGIMDIDRNMIERLVHGAKTFGHGKRVNINHNYYLFVGKNDLALVRHER